MDWEMRAKGLANDLQVAAVLLIAAGAWMMWQHSGWLELLTGGWLLGHGCLALRDGKIAP